MHNKKRNFLKELEKDVILCAEGYVYELERRGYVKAGPYVPEVVLDNPEALKQLHIDYLRAGSDVVEALTYYAHRDKLKDIGREGELESMNRQALKIAKEVADMGNAFVAGNVCNTWVYDHKNKEETSKKVKDMYREQIGWAAEEGVDFIISETIEYLGEALLALEVTKEFDLPAVVTLAPTGDKSRDGYDWVEACATLEKEGADVVGLNCIEGPQTMMPLLKEIRGKLSGFMAALPVPYATNEEHKHFQYLPEEGGEGFVPPYDLDPYLLSRTQMAKFAKEAQEIGINYIGICCGAGPHHVRAMAEALGKKPEAGKYSPDMKKHSQLGDSAVKKHNKDFVKSK